jgi:DNA-binding NtrC family response regulator
MAEPVRVLLVDDDESSRTALVWLLEDAGFAVIEARSLQEGRARLAAMCASPSTTPELVLVDVHLGDGLGTALLPEVRAAAPRAKTAVVSGAADPPDLAHADLALTKGHEPAEAIAALKRLVGA